MPNPSFLVRLLMRFVLLEMRCSGSPTALTAKASEGFFGAAGNGQDQLDVSENSGTPKSSILIGFSLINRSFWGTPVFGNTQLEMYKNHQKPSGFLVCVNESIGIWRKKSEMR